MTLPYREGDHFAVPLRDGGYATGVVARAPAKGKVLFGYFFGPKRPGPPSADDIAGLSAEDAVKFCRFGDLSLINGEWPIVFRPAEWNRDDWPMPNFARVEELGGRAWLVEYADDDPNKVLSESPLAEPVIGIERDAVFGAGAVELLLTKLLGDR